MQPANRRPPVPFGILSLKTVHFVEGFPRSRRLRLPAHVISAPSAKSVVQFRSVSTADAVDSKPFTLWPPRRSSGSISVSSVAFCKMLWVRLRRSRARPSVAIPDFGHRRRKNHKTWLSSSETPIHKKASRVVAETRRRSHSPQFSQSGSAATEVQLAAKGRKNAQR
jgi:hypothetical protein